LTCQQNLLLQPRFSDRYKVYPIQVAIFLIASPDEIRP
jgi:hypothetical protein